MPRPPYRSDPRHDETPPGEWPVPATVPTAERSAIDRAAELTELRTTVQFHAVRIDRIETHLDMATGEELTATKEKLAAYEDQAKRRAETERQKLIDDANAVEGARLKKLEEEIQRRRDRAWAIFMLVLGGSVSLAVAILAALALGLFKK